MLFRARRFSSKSNVGEVSSLVTWLVVQLLLVTQCYPMNDISSVLPVTLNQNNNVSSLLLWGEEQTPANFQDIPGDGVVQVYSADGGRELEWTKSVMHSSEARGRNISGEQVFDNGKLQGLSETESGQVDINPGEQEDPDEEQQETMEAYEKYGFNKFLSDRIPLNRTLRDFRNEMCQEKYDNLVREKLPSASVIITFHNEPLSTLARTLYSVLNRSPEQLLHEVILIDDFSENQSDTWTKIWTELVEGSRENVKVKVIRTFQREGVARARTLGAVNAQADVLIFLDSHVEVTEGWLEPLLSRMLENGETIVAPTVGVIDANTFKYKSSSSSSPRVGLFDWKLEIKWSRPRDSILKNISLSPTAPFPSAVIPFGMFAISREFFEKLGYFDTKFEKWGGEALELSFKAWMCGGRIEISPCSHIGHLFKGDQSPENLESLQNNLRRLASTWMGNYAKYYYEMTSTGDDFDFTENVASRLDIGHRLNNCKPFSWYLEQIAPEVFNPDLSVGEGEVRNSAFGSYLCLDASSASEAISRKVGIWPCHNFGGNEYWHYSNLGELRRVDLCLDYSHQGMVIMYYCQRRFKTQRWLYDYKTQLIHHPSTSKCLAMDAFTDLFLEECNPSVVTQRWSFRLLNMDRLTVMLKDVFHLNESSIT